PRAARPCGTPPTPGRACGTRGATPSPARSAPSSAPPPTWARTAGPARASEPESTGPPAAAREEEGAACGSRRRRSSRAARPTGSRREDRASYACGGGERWRRSPEAWRSGPEENSPRWNANHVPGRGVTTLTPCLDYNQYPVLSTQAEGPPSSFWGLDSGGGGGLPGANQRCRPS